MARLRKFTFAAGKWRHADIPLPERGNGTLAMNFANPAEKTAFYLWQTSRSLFHSMRWTHRATTCSG